MTKCSQTSDYITAPQNRYDVAANIAHFLMAQELSIFGHWEGKMSAADQRRIFGIKLGKGTIAIDGENEEIIHYYKTCYGNDRERSVWMDCKTGYIGRNFWSIGSDHMSAHELEIETAKEWFK
jgi:hypothetical protein